MSGLEPTINNPVQWRQALQGTWIVLSLLALLALLSPFLVEHQALLALSQDLQSDHPPGSCVLCGMTRAFLALSQGEWRQAQTFNSYALGLWILIWLNSAGLVYAVGARMKNRTKV